MRFGSDWKGFGVKVARPSASPPPPVASKLQHKSLLLISSCLESSIISSQESLWNECPNHSNVLELNMDKNASVSVFFQVRKASKRIHWHIKRFSIMLNVLRRVVFVSVESDFVPATNVSVLQAVFFCFFFGLISLICFDFWSYTVFQMFFSASPGIAAKTTAIINHYMQQSPGCATKLTN